MDTSSQFSFEFSVEILDRSQKNEQFPYEIELLSKPFDVFENVFSPKYLPAADWFARKLPIHKGMNFLEIGPGIGVVALMAATWGCRQVVACDINVDAVRNTRHNAKKHGVEDTVEVRHGNVYEGLNDGDTFDLIFWNVPFFMAEPTDHHDVLQLSITDPGYRAIRTYVAQADQFLKPGGKLMLGFSSTLGNFNALHTVVAECGRTLRMFCQESFMSQVPLSLELFEAIPTDDVIGVEGDVADGLADAPGLG